MSRNKLFFNLVLGIVACIFVVSLPTLAMSRTAVLPVQSQSVEGYGSPLNSTLNQFDPAIANQLVLELQEAETVLLAQTGSPADSSTTSPTSPATSPLTRYVAVLSGSNVVPSASTSAFGAAGAVLSGNRLIVRGDFRNLSSPLRDYATDPLNPPNPNITSGVHLHKGEPGKNGPFQYALQVQPGADEKSGRVQGEYTLTDEQLQALSTGMMYVDLHTKQNRAGELRGVLKSY